MLTTHERPVLAQRDQAVHVLIDAVLAHPVVNELAKIVMPLCGRTERTQLPNAYNLNLYRP